MRLINQQVFALSGVLSLTAAESGLPPEAQKVLDKANTAIAAVNKTASEQIAKIRV